MRTIVFQLHFLSAFVATVPVLVLMTMFEKTYAVYKERVDRAWALFFMYWILASILLLVVFSGYDVYRWLTS